MKKLFLGLLCALLSFSAQAQFSGAGSGTSEDPYQITNADELAEMAYFLSRTGVCFQLMNDIDLTQWITDNNPTQGWTPIGVDSDRFKGVLNGDGHTISGLYLNRPNFANVGLFGYVESATIKNLHVTGTNVTGGNSTGGLVGVARSSAISDCSISLSGVTYGGSSVGGFAGQIFNSTISSCEYQGDVQASDNHVGGLIGYAASAIVTDCVAIADVDNSGNENIGGIIGESQYNLTCTGCRHQGDIKGGNHLGGIVGYLYDFRSGTTIQSCSHNGDLLGSLSRVGGIVGSCRAGDRMNGISFLIIQCFSSGNIEGKQGVGGILGWEEELSWAEGSFFTMYYNYGTIKINNCYSHVNIKGEQFVGGIVGKKDSNGEIKNCYMAGSVSGEDCIAGIVGCLGHRSNFASTVSSNCTILYSLNAKSHYGRVCGILQYGTIGAVGSQSGNRACSMCSVTVNGQEVTVEESELNGTSVSLSALKNPNTYIGLGWDFTDTWTINNGKTFPYLRWEKRINTIELNRTDLIMSLGESATLVATIAPVDADLMELDWSSSDESVATVADGFVQALAEGRTTITAKAKDGSEIEAVCLITVTNNNDSRPADFDNVVYMESFTANAGDEIEVPILMKNQKAGDIIDFEFDLYLPDGISAVLEDGEAIVETTGERTTARNHPMYGEINDDGSIKVYSSSRRGTSVFSGTDGEIATILLKVADDAADGVYHIVIRNISMESFSNDDPYTVGRFNLSAGIGDLIKTITDGESYQEAEDFSVDKLRFTRNFKNTTWQALYVPFSIPVATLEAHGLKVAELNDTHQYFDANTGALIQTEVEFRYVTSGVTQPNYPYVIKAETAGVVEIELENVQLMATQETEIECSTTRQIFKIKGTYTGISGEEMLQKNYYAMGGGTLVRVAEENPSALKPQRWYMEIVNKDGSAVDYFAPSIRLKIDGIDEESTGISDCVEQSSEAPVYDLQGRLVKAGNLKSGMYVKDHKKIIVL